MVPAEVHFVLPTRRQKLVGEFSWFWGGESCGKFGGDLTGFFRIHKIGKGRAWAKAVRRGSYESLFLLNSGRLSLET